MTPLNPHLTRVHARFNHPRTRTFCTPDLFIIFGHGIVAVALLGQIIVIDKQKKQASKQSFSRERFLSYTMTVDNSSVESPLPKRKSRLRGKGGGGVARRPPSSGGNVVPLTHFLPKNWLVLWVTGLFCLATITILPILMLEYSTILGSDPQSSAASHHGVHVLMDAAMNMRARADLLRPGKAVSSAAQNQQVPKIEIPKLEKKKDAETQKDKPLSLTEKQEKPHYTLVDLPQDPIDWQSKPLARGLAGRPMEETPALIGAQRAHVECDIPVDSLAYWNNPIGDRDENYVPPFKPKLSPGKIQYITFTPDRGGWNNIR